MLDLDPYGGTDPFGMFTRFLKKAADVLAPRLIIIIIIIIIIIKKDWQ